MATFVLVHGAWHGGWCWQRLAPRLTERGHTVVTPTLTGLGDRSHLLTESIGLRAHVDDLVATFEFEDLNDAILVGHSYAGLVISQAAGRLRDRLARLIFLDAFVPDDGDSAFTLLPDHVSTAMQDAARDKGHGWLIPPRPLDVLGVTDPGAVAWLEPRLVPHPLRSYQDRVSVSSELAQVPSEFVHCNAWAAVFHPFAVKARERGWPVTELPVDHEVMATAPDLLADVLHDAGSALDTTSSPTRTRTATRNGVR